MIFVETSLKGSFVVELEPREDARGLFARSFCREEFQAHGLKTDIAQCNISANRKRGTLRGMHFQKAPRAEAKLVRCTRGVAYDVIIDLRPVSPTFCRWTSVELSAGRQNALYVPEGFAHGFQTLEDNVELFYSMFEFHSPDHSAGVRWDDPAFGIQWPIANPILSPRDRSYELFKKDCA